MGKILFEKKKICICIKLYTWKGYVIVQQIIFRISVEYYCWPKNSFVQPVLMVRFTCSNCGGDLSVEIMNKYNEKVKSIMHHVFCCCRKYSLLYFTESNS